MFNTNIDILIWIAIDIAFVIISLGAGVASVLLAMQMNSKYKFDYLNSFMYYQILLFIFGLYGLFGTLFVRSVMNDYDIPQLMIKQLAEFIPYIGVPVIITAWFIFIKMSFELVGRTISRHSGLLYFGSIILSLFIYIYLIVYHFGEESLMASTLVSYSKFAFVGLEIVTLLIAFFVMFRYGVKLNHRYTRQLIFYFAIISITMSTITITIFMFSAPNTIVEKLYLLLFFAGQLPSVLFLGYYLQKYFSPALVKNSKQGAKEFIISNYQLSKREWEIVEKICDGLTNGQISDSLFISVQTVKDHVYRIYKKTGVKNRVQLVNIIRSR